LTGRDWQCSENTCKGQPVIKKPLCGAGGMSQQTESGQDGEFGRLGMQHRPPPKGADTQMLCSAPIRSWLLSGGLGKSQSGESGERRLDQRGFRPSRQSCEVAANTARLGLDPRFWRTASNRVVFRLWTPRRSGFRLFGRGQASKVKVTVTQEPPWTMRPLVG
jgi:hypothetical protein